MLSLNPRFDLFVFNFPKDMFPEELIAKYNEVLYKNAGVTNDCINYLNESIQGISIPGISAENPQQEQHEFNPIKRGDTRINVEPSHQITYQTFNNPLSMIDKDFKVTFRANQGLYNYFLMYETFFHAVCKQYNKQPISRFIINLLDETGKITANIILYNLVFNSMDGLDFTYSQLDRESKTFDVSFTFNNIDFDFVV